MANGRVRSLLAILLAATSAVAFPAGEALHSTPGAEQVWRFRVFLDRREIGFHEFRVAGDAAAQTVHSTAEFDVRFLFFKAYRYRHHNRETWQDGCLRRIEAVTDENGRIHRVAGAPSEDAFMVVTGGEVRTRVDGCVRSFAYWNAGLLDTAGLLNAQTGEVQPVNFERRGDAWIDIAGERVLAEQVALVMREGTITLWYAVQDGRWLALEAPAAGDRVLRYEPVAVPGAPYPDRQVAMH